MKWLTITFFLATTWNHAQGYFITVDSRSEECFFDKVDFGTKMGISLLY